MVRLKTLLYNDSTFIATIRYGWRYLCITKSSNTSHHYDHSWVVHLFIPHTKAPTHACLALHPLLEIVYIYIYQPQESIPFHPHYLIPITIKMYLEELDKNSKKKKTERVTFSANLPNDIHGVFAESDCAVHYSSNPFRDIRKSILEMIRYVKVQDWNDIEELIYCYIALNSPEIHLYIKDAFLSVSSHLYNKRYHTDQC